MEIGDLQGYSGAHASYSACTLQTGNHEPMVKTVRWLVQARPGTVLKLTAFQQKAGKAEIQITL